MLPVLLLYLLGGDELAESNKTVLDFLVEQTSDFLALILELHVTIMDVTFHFFENVYVSTFGTFFDFVMNIINLRSIEFADNGRTFVNSIFANLSFNNPAFTQNFLFWFVGLLLFAFCAKIFFGLIFGLFKTLVSALLGFKL